IVGPSENVGGGYFWQDLVLSDGGRIHFTRISPCNGVGVNPPCDYAGAVYQTTTGPADFQGAIIKAQTCNQNGSAVAGAWLLTKKDGSTICFADSDGSTDYRSATPLWTKDRFGNMITFSHDDLCCLPNLVNAHYPGNLTQITSANGRYIKLT